MAHEYAITLLLGLSVLTFDANGDEPSVLLKKAIAAHGDAKKITKPRMGVLKATGTASGGFEVHQEDTFDLPKRWKRVTTGSFRGEKLVGYNLMIDGKFWEWEDGGEVRQTSMEVSPPGHYFLVLADLVEFATDKAKLAPLKEVQVDGKPAAGFRATRRDKEEVDHYVDKTTGLLRQQEFKFIPEPGKKWDMRLVYDDYREVDGVKVPFRRVIFIKRENQQEYAEYLAVVVTEVRILDRIPDSVFALPGKK